MFNFLGDVKEANKVLELHAKAHEYHVDMAVFNDFDKATLTQLFADADADYENEVNGIGG